MKKLSLTAALVLMASQGWAACADPVGEEGQMVYNSTHKVMQFCNGTGWVSMASTYASGAWVNNGSGDLVTTSGNVGVGIDTPSAPLTVVGPAGLGWVLRATTEGYSNISGIWSSSAHNMILVARDNTGDPAANIASSGSSWLTGGALGLGTKAPDSLLDIRHDVDVWGGITLGEVDVDTEVFKISHYGGPSSGTKLAQEGDLPIRFSTNNTDRMYILGNGNVGIGESAPDASLEIAGDGEDLTADLHVNGDVLLNNDIHPAIHLIESDNSSYDWSFAADGGNITIRMNNTSPYYFVVTNAGNIGMGVDSPSYKLQVNGEVYATTLTESSDRRLKKNIHALSYGLTDVLKLRPVTFAWKKPQTKSLEGPQVGFIAQDVEEVIPEVVNTANDEMGTKSIQYTSLVPVAIKAIQELSAENAALRKRQSDYERHNMALEKRLEAMEDQLKALSTK